MHHPTERIAYTTAFVTPVVEHWLEREIAQWVQIRLHRVCEDSASGRKSIFELLRGRAFAHGAMVRRIDPSWGGPIELFLVPASAPRLV